MRDTIVETILATAILIWGISEGLVHWTDADEASQHEMQPVPSATVE